MLLDLKNEEIDQLKEKNAELKKHIELLQKRVYSKTEFENFNKQLKTENSELEAKLKVSERIRKQQQSSIKELQSQVNKFRRTSSKQDRPKTAQKAPQQKAGKKLKSSQNEENVDETNFEVVVKQNKSRDSNTVMMPKYSTFGEGQNIDQSNPKIAEKKAKKSVIKKVKPKKDTKVVKKYMR